MSRLAAFVLGIVAGLAAAIGIDALVWHVDQAGEWVWRQ